jgi:3-ketosteroid 9alpha-monooxygenase subunit A
MERDMKQAPYIESKPIPNRYARGWHCLGLAQEFKDGKPHKLDIFGTKLVAFQGALDGQVHILDAYCPHMGADLSTGEVKGDAIQCPFHHWQWNGEGKCVEIPYCKRISPKAKTRAWHTCEQNHLLFVYNDPEGNPPPPEVAIPRIEACYTGEWTDWLTNRWIFNTNCRELVDNLADEAHFGPVHGAPNEYFANLFEGHKASQITKGGSETLSEGRLSTYNTYFGPAYHITHMVAEQGGQVIESILLNTHVPRDLNSFHQCFGVMVKKIPGMTEEENNGIAQAYSKAVFDAFAQDQVIWDNKIRIDNPMLCENDGPIYQLRKWYSQFYMDVADVPKEFAEATLIETVRKCDPPVPHHVFED